MPRTAMRHTPCVLTPLPSVLHSVACRGVDVSSNGKRCAACKKGKRPNKQRSTCEECPSGQYFSAAKLVCMSCNAGDEIGANRSTCVPCGAGMQSRRGIAGWTGRHACLQYRLQARRVPAGAPRTLKTLQGTFCSNIRILGHEGIAAAVFWNPPLPDGTGAAHSTHAGSE